MAPRELQDELQRARPLRITAATWSEASFVGRVEGKFLGGSGGVPAGFQRGSKPVSRVPVFFQPIIYGGSGDWTWGYYNINYG